MSGNGHDDQAQVGFVSRLSTAWSASLPLIYLCRRRKNISAQTSRYNSFSNRLQTYWILWGAWVVLLSELNSTALQPIQPSNPCRLDRRVSEATLEDRLYTCSTGGFYVYSAN